MEVRENGSLIFQVSRAEVVETTFTKTDIVWGNANLEIGVKPTQEFLAQNFTWLPPMVLITGSLISILLGSLLQAMTRARNRERQFVQTERVMADRLHVALKSAQIGVWSINLTNQDVWRSPNHDEIYGHAQRLSEWNQATFMAHVHPEDRERVHASFKENAKGMGSPNVEFRIIRADDQSVGWIRSVSHLLLGPDGKPQQLLGTVHDTTVQKLEAEDRATTTERLQRVVEATEEGILELDYPTTKITFVDDQGKRIFGLRPDEELTLEHVRKLILEEDRLAALAALQDHVARGTDRFELEFRTVGKSARNYRWVRLRGKVITDANGVGRYITTIGDITEEVKIRARLQEALKKAEAGTMAKSAFLANMSHEIRTPINSIVGMCGFLMDTELIPEQRGYIDDLKTNVDILLSVINDILDFSKIEAGKLDLETIEFDVEETVSGLLKAMRYLARQKSVHFEYIGPENIGHQFLGDPGRLRQILANLISNAIKFTAAGKISLRVQKISELDEKTKFRFEVQDRGIGIPAEEVLNLFKPFSQADISTTRKYGGSGLGLSICKQLVDLFGGEIGVMSEVGQGSTFWFEITLRRGKPFSKEELAVVEISRDFTGARVLVAEDNPFNQIVIKKHLQKFSIVADMANNGLEAVTAISSKPYDIVLMDCNMPEMDGFEATRLIRQLVGDGKISHVPIVATTANAFKESRLECIAAGMDDYISKPIAVADLYRVLNEWIAPQSGAAVVAPPSATSLGIGGQQTKPAISTAAGSALDKLAQLQVPGEEDFIIDLIDTFFAQGALGFEVLDVAVKAQNKIEIVREMHKLKSASRTMGAEAFGNLCEQIEKLASSGNTGEVLSRYPEVLASFDGLKVELADIRAQRMKKAV